MNNAVLSLIDKSCKEQDLSKTLRCCKEYNMPILGVFLSNALLQQRKDVDNNKDLIKYYNDFLKQIKINETIKIQLLCNWCTSKHLCQLWNKMLPIDSNIMLTDHNPDYWIIINSPPPNTRYNKKKTIVFHMEPYMTIDYETDEFLAVFTHDSDYNNVEWHLSKNVSELLFLTPNKTKVLSAILSDKYYDIGHVKRINFVKALEKCIDIDVYGSNVFDYKSYCGSLPCHEKDNGLFPYKYHFNAENNDIPNYFTEKIIDAILSECLCFYWGCPNITDYIDKRAFIILDLNDIEKSIEQVKNMIENDEWSKRIDVIRLEKRKILTDMNMFNRIKKFIS